VPANNGIWLYYNQCASPITPELCDKGNKKAVAFFEGRLFGTSPKHGKLLPEKNILGRKRQSAKE
jgi:hypothetical protein